MDKIKVSIGNATVNLINAFVNLLKIKSIVTLAVIAVFVSLAINSTISPDNVMIIVSAVISFYFGTQHQRESDKK